MQLKSGSHLTRLEYLLSIQAFKSDSQRLAVSLRSSIAKRRSHLNVALFSLSISHVQFTVQVEW
ncbi:hypothetical protein DC909_25885 [Vibrio parahaemolyticus]|nr:hypothetical protein [Vibrio parahaemolyticus]